MFEERYAKLIEPIFASLEDLQPYLEIEEQWKIQKIELALRELFEAANEGEALR